MDITTTLFSEHWDYDIIFNTGHSYVYIIFIFHERHSREEQGRTLDEREGKGEGGRKPVKRFRAVKCSQVKRGKLKTLS